MKRIVAVARPAWCWIASGIMVVSAGLFAIQAGAQSPEPDAIYRASCSVCHVPGLNGAPKISDAGAWQSRLAARGRDGLVASAVTGLKGMPPRGGNLDLTDAQIGATIEHMLKLAGVDKGGTAALGRQTYDKVCGVCHQSGVAGAPKAGDKAAWQPRLAAGRAALLANALNGKGAMPARGGNPAVTEEALEAAVDYLIASVQPEKPSAESKPEPAVTTPAKKEVADKPVADKAAVAQAGKTAPAADTTQAATPPARKVSRVNSFNRLMRPPSKRNAPPMRDGIHDPINAGTAQLQPPRQSFDALPKAGAGNGVDWVLSLNDGHIAPRTDKEGTGAEMAVMDMNIIREVKGSMPDVVYPHKQHTEWLDCSNCHPAIFIPRKGANQISMASIMLGEKCGVCHGKVAFPVAECRRCHSKNKQTVASAKGGGK